MLGIVYKYTNRNNSKVYIGQTFRPHKRKLEHIRNKKNSRFTAAIKHYGIDSFDYEILFSVEKEDKAALISILNEKERHYIAFYNSNNIHFGYNMTSGGEGTPKHPLTEKVKKVLDKTGTKWPDKQYQSYKQSRKGMKYNWKHLYGRYGKKVLQFTKDGILVKEYSSLNEASKAVGAAPSNISVVLHGRRKTALGFIWKLAD